VKKSLNPLPVQREQADMKVEMKAGKRNEKKQCDGLKR
jgi:hypothetical protein